MPKYEIQVGKKIWTKVKTCVAKFTNVPTYLALTNIFIKLMFLLIRFHNYVLNPVIHIVNAMAGCTCGRQKVLAAWHNWDLQHRGKTSLVGLVCRNKGDLPVTIPRTPSVPSAQKSCKHLWFVWYLCMYEFLLQKWV